MKKVFFVILCIYSIVSHSATTEKVYFVHLKANSAKLRGQLAKLIHIDHVTEDSVFSYVNEHDLRQLEKYHKDLIIESRLQIEYDPNPISSEIEFPRKDEKYHTYLETIKVLDNLVISNPSISEKFSIGTSLQGLDIAGIKISGLNHKKVPLLNPAILFLGAHHAREHLSTEIPLLLAKYLVENYDINPEIRSLIDSRIIYIVPMVNPDGAMYDIKGRKYKSWRKNRARNSNGSFGVDLNRNYSFGWGTGGSSRNPRSDVFMGPKPFSEPETLAVKSFVESNPNIKILTSFHTFSELILYPWGGKDEDVGGRDQKVFEKMATTMAKWNKYKPQKASDLYIASGDTCDWAYGVHKIFCFTFELSPRSIWGGGFYPGSAIIDKTFKANLRPALYLIKNSLDPYGVLNGM